jgi:hypothetical protein
MMRRILLVALMLLAPLSRAGAQATPEQRIDAARQQAARAGVPVSLLDAKVAEGRAKGVPMDRIAAAIEHRLGSLERARDAMASGPRPPALTPADLNVGADALDAGVDPGALGTLARAAAADRRAVAIAVLTELVQEGLASDVALQRVTQALARGPDALRQLPGENGNGHGQARRGPPDERGPANAVTHGNRGQGGGGPPASVPGRSGGNGNGHGKGHGRP